MCFDVSICRDYRRATANKYGSYCMTGKFGDFTVMIIWRGKILQIQSEGNNCKYNFGWFS